MYNTNPIKCRVFIECLLSDCHMSNECPLSAAYLTLDKLSTLSGIGGVVSNTLNHKNTKGGTLENMMTLTFDL